MRRSFFEKINTTGRDLFVNDFNKNFGRDFFNEKSTCGVGTNTKTGSKMTIKIIKEGIEINNLIKSN